MIITCNNCNKIFDIDSSLIPDKGRLLQCSNCNHKWYFKKDILENSVSLTAVGIDRDNVNNFDQNNPIINKENNPSDLSNKEVEAYEEEELNKKIEINTNVEKPVLAKKKKPKNFKILNFVIVAIISFVAFIIIVDTFKYPIGKIVPSIEFILYNLYESIKDISLFISDLT